MMYLCTVCDLGADDDVCVQCACSYTKSASYVYVSFVNFMHIPHELDIDITSTCMHDECQDSVVIYACVYV